MKKYCLDCNKPKSKKGNYCKSCGYKHRKRPSGLKYNIIKNNRGWFKKGCVSLLKGKTIKKFKECSGEYSSLHKWIRRNWKIPKKCSKCNSIKNIEWSNKSGKYLRLKSDWITLCKKCHHEYDYLMFGARSIFYERKKI